MVVTHIRKNVRGNGQRVSASGKAQHCVNIYVNGKREHVYYTDNQTAQELAERIAAKFAAPTGIADVAEHICNPCNTDNFTFFA